MKQILVIFLGGGFGALSRFGLSKVLAEHAGTLFPVGTFTINVFGSFVMGFLFGFFDRMLVPSDLRAFLTIGFLGAFTTFSTYALESVRLMQGGQWRMALINIALTNGAGLAALLFGFFISTVMNMK